MALVQLAAPLVFSVAVLAVGLPASAYELCDRGFHVVDVGADAEVRQRIVDIAVGEWRRFGFQVLDLSTAEVNADLSPLLGFSVPLDEMPAPLLGMAKGRLMRIGFAENEAESTDAVRGYWRAVIANDAYVDRVPLSSAAWSAAFVSWVMCRAGFSDAQFQRRDAHVLYVAGAFQAEAQFGATWQNGYAYLARPFENTPVEPGDLACFSNAGIGFDERRAISLAGAWAGRDPRSHCDIIVGFAADGARVLAIGGNVQQSVTLSLFAARRDGANTYLLGPSEWRAARPFYAILKLRARPDIAGAVTIPYARVGG